MPNVARTPSHEPDFRILAALERSEPPALLAAALASGGILLLWNLPALYPYAPIGWSQMPLATAAGMLLATISLMLTTQRRPPLAVRIGQIVGLFCLVVPVLVLLHHAGLYPYHVFRWPVPPPWPTAAAFALAALSLPLIRESRGPLSVVADVGAVAVIAFTLFLFGAWVFQVKAFIGVDGMDLTSPQTLFCLTLLAFVIGSRRATEGRTFSILVNVGIGSQITRKVLPAVLVAPFLIFLLISFLNRNGFASVPISRAVSAPLVVLATLAVLAWMGWHANQLERQLRQQSLTDELTGILNRRGFETVAQYTLLNARRARAPLVVFFFDLDGLKQVNDTLGHDVGSEMIRAFADVLSTTFRKADIIARVGGDEFVVLASATAATAAELLVRLKRNVDAGNAAGGSLFRISYSDGHAALTSGGERSIEDLVAEADAMMYAGKVRKRA